MIFVTVGTHEQGFNRLIKEIDELLAQRIIDDEVQIQSGYSTYQSRYAKTTAMLSYKQMQLALNEADLVICHGGPATYMSALSLGKRVIVVPRQKCFAEHINDHQKEFIIALNQRGYNIPWVDDIKTLGELICQATKAELPISHTEIFFQQLKSQLANLLCEK